MKLFSRRRREPMLIEDGIAYCPNRSARRALGEAQRWEHGEIELYAYVPYTTKDTRNDGGSERCVF